MATNPQTSVRTATDYQAGTIGNLDDAWTRRLVASVGRAESGARYITDAAIADREWAENTDPTRGPGSAREGETSLGDAAAREKVARAKLLELEYKEKTGVLVNAADVKAAIAQAITRARTNILAAPSKLKAARPNLTREDLAALDRILRESLEEVAEHEAPAQPAEVTSNDQNKAS